MKSNVLDTVIKKLFGKAFKADSTALPRAV